MTRGDKVVSYRNSTSNHNVDNVLNGAEELYLIEILHQTTTMPWPLLKRWQLYLIEILHQTTTTQAATCAAHGLYLIEILHQTTTRRNGGRSACGCILSKFYIKPQPFEGRY